ncbi:MAG: ATP:cob(I)alamin adenosyltransferase, partial [Chloroflexi bacterium]|nr:ATP:cob(I)alamin adenosyltransferase [Chloroflexota bacterium]
QVQRDLYRVMGEVAATPDQAEKFRAIGAEQVGWLEESIERLQVGVEMPGEFIVPGDTLPAAMLDVARTIARRAERRLVELFHQGELGNPELLRYLNRLSSLCYVIELKEHHESGIDRPTLARK